MAWCHSIYPSYISDGPLGAFPSSQSARGEQHHHEEGIGRDDQPSRAAPETAPYVSEHKGQSGEAHAPTRDQQPGCGRLGDRLVTSFRPLTSVAGTSEARSRWAAVPDRVTPDFGAAFRARCVT